MCLVLYLNPTLKLCVRAYVCVSYMYSFLLVITAVTFGLMFFNFEKRDFCTILTCVTLITLIIMLIFLQYK